MVKKYLIFIWAILAVSLTYGQITDSSEYLITIVEEIPYFEGDLIEFIQSKIDYPLSAKSDSIEGTVFIVFKIDTLGFTIDHKVIRGIREDLDNEALRVARLIKFEKPGLQRGQPIEVKYTVPFRFRLANSEKKLKFKK